MRVLSVVLFVALVCSFFIFNLPFPIQQEPTTAFAEMPNDRASWLQKTLADPVTGAIPEHMHALELAYASTLPKGDIAHGAANKASLWQARGPWNIGGRTRAFAIDVNDENTLLTAGVSGGIWKSTIGGSGWARKTRTDQLPNITCLIQDTRLGKTQTWYAGTGEFRGGLTFGDGVYKSTDNGDSWEVLANTSSGVLHAFDQDWDFVWNLAIDTSNNNEDELYAATAGSIWKSVNGGQNWTRRRGGLASGNRYSNYTDVAITGTGVVYATLSDDGAHKGIWRSEDGDSWTNITPTAFPIAYDRMVIGINPSNQNQLYILAVTPNAGQVTTNFLGNEEWNSLWKYTYQSGDGSGTGGTWEDLSANIPKTGGQFGNFNAQGGYNLFVKVKPDDPNVVFLGGTNLWRSTDAYTTSDNISWIGGYGVNTMIPDFKLYPNHHPDQHGMVFYPSDPNRSISFHDGGLSLTEDILASNVIWSSLNNGYYTTQFYDVTLDHGTSGGDAILGGLQDNGSLFTGSADPQANWTMPFSYDGGHSAITPGGSFHYVSIQLGRIYRLKLNTQGNPTEFARIDPPGNYDYLFINPFVLDPNEPKRLYMAAGDRVMRNNDAEARVASTEIDSSRSNLNWDELTNTLATNQTISAIHASSQPANRLYYGTNSGRLYRIDNAHQGDPMPQNITSPFFPSNGNITCIATNPDNADDLFVVFSNYRVQSIYHSTDGGATWGAISGNLEEQISGSGNGPSCRWFSVAKIQNQLAYFVGTTTGLYATTQLDSMQTEWRLQSPDLIGNNHVESMDFRESDGMLVVGTYGVAAYSADLDYLHQITSVDELSRARSSFNLFPNPIQSKGQLALHLTQSTQVKAILLDQRGRQIGSLLKENLTAGDHTLAFELPQVVPGTYYCRVKMGDEWLTKKMIIE